VHNIGIVHSGTWLLKGAVAPQFALSATRKVSNEIDLLFSSIIYIYHEVDVPNFDDRIFLPEDI